MTDYSKLKWGNIDERSINSMTNELLDNVYERYFKVEKNDIVVDIGAFIGGFTYSILDRKPEHCWVVEPVEEHFRILYENLKGNPVSFVRGAISDKNTEVIKWCGYESDSPGINFKNFIKNNCIDKIDFLKVDCEGGEYFIFTEENLHYLKNNVNKFSGEFHLFNLELKEKFRYFRDNILIKFDNYNITSYDGVDIKWDIFNEHFIEYYSEIIIHIKN